MSVATITSTQGAYSGSVADCLAWLSVYGGASANLIIGGHTLPLVGEAANTAAFEVEDCYVEAVSGPDDGQPQTCRVTRASGNLVEVTFDDDSRVWMGIETLVDGTLLPA